MNGWFRFLMFLAASMIGGWGASAQSFLPPGALNPGAQSDSGSDIAIAHVIDSRNVAHAVWTSTNDFTGDSGADYDLFYSTNDGSGWMTPILVNSYGRLDTGVESLPKLALGLDDSLHCVWVSTSDYAGTESDPDIFYATLVGGEWSSAEFVNDYAEYDVTNSPWGIDARPAIAVDHQGRVCVAWETDYQLGISSNPVVTTGTDGDIFYSIRTPAGWSPAQFLNSNATGDIGKDEGPIAMTTTGEGSIIAVWRTNDNVRTINPLGTDYDIVWSELPPNGNWSPIEEVSALARSDSGDDLNPAVVAIGSGYQREIHVAWSSNEPLDGSGTDYDILHTIIGAVRVVPAANPAWLVNAYAQSDAAPDIDGFPALCFEPGGVLHCAWASTRDILTGTDWDIYHATNATHGNAWSPVELLNLNGLFDIQAASDMFVDLRCAPNDLLSAAWMSKDDLGGTIGTDDDILHAVGFGRGVTRPEPINNTAPYDDPNLPGGGGDNDFDPRIAIAPGGTIHAVFSSGYPGAAPGLNTGQDDDIFHAILGPGGWEDAELVNGANDSGADEAVDFCIDDSGTLHAVWASNENVGGALGTDYDLLYSRRGPAGWTQPELVNSDGATDPPTWHDDYNPRIAVDQNGIVHVAWQRLFYHQAPQNHSSDIAYTWHDSEGWHPYEVVNAAYAQTLNVIDWRHDLALDADGFPHVVWQTTANYNSAGADDDIFYSNRMAGGWSAPEFVNDGAAQDGAYDIGPAIAFTPDGVLYCVWSSNLNIQGAGTDYDLLIASRQNGAWSAAQLLVEAMTADSGGESDPDLITDKEGGLHVAWVSSDGGFINLRGTDLDILYAHIPLPAVFPAPVPVLTANATAFGDSENDYEPQLLIDRDRLVHFAWLSLDTLGGKLGQDFDLLHARTLNPYDPEKTAAGCWMLYE